MSESPLSLGLAGFNHHQTPLALREKWALSADSAGALGDRLRARPGVRDVVLLRTCNRVEVYVAGGTPDLAETVAAELRFAAGIDPAEWVAHGLARADGEVVRHLFEVCAGLDSQMVGETEVLGQVKAAYQEALQRGHVQGPLHRIFQKAFQAAKWARSETGIGLGQVSLGNVAVDLAERIFGALADCRVLVLGGGEVGSDTAKAFASRGVRRLAVSSRTAQRAQRLAAEVGAEVLDFADWAGRLAESDVVICCTSAPGFIVTPAEVDPVLPQRGDRPLFFIDVALPRDVDPAVAVDNVFLYNLDDLAAIANENLAHRLAEVGRARRHLEERAGRIWESVAGPRPPRPDPASG